MTLPVPWLRSQDDRWPRLATALAGLAAAAVYVLPGLAAPDTHWPLWDVRVYWWAGQADARGAALYPPGPGYRFTYPPFAAVLFRAGAAAPEGWLAAAITAASVVALAVLCWLSLEAAGVRRRPETVFAVTALAMLTWPVAYTLHLGEVNLILAALVAADLLRRRDGGASQGIATGLAAGVKLTPLIFVAYLLVTCRLRAAAAATAAFAATVAVGFALLPSQSDQFWLHGLFADQSRIGNPANPSDQSLAGAIARLAGTGDPPRTWWLAAAVTCGLAGLAVARWAHLRGHRLAGVTCCAVTGLLVSPFSWAHHWVWAVPLLVLACTMAWRHRSPGWVLAAAAAAAVFSGLIPLPPPGHHRLGLATLLAGDLYVLAGLAVLAGAASALARQRPLSRHRAVSLGKRGVTTRAAATAARTRPGTPRRPMFIESAIPAAARAREPCAQWPRGRLDRHDANPTDAGAARAGDRHPRRSRPARGPVRDRAP
ncbi:MAG: DUF2029 domain-containing protein [Streptosporangiaceae bacterium]|nr:DUF2029 domain-containing protein [Streptosporangiaceae bacterium]